MTTKQELETERNALTVIVGDEAALVDQHTTISNEIATATQALTPLIAKRDELSLKLKDITTAKQRLIQVKADLAVLSQS